MNSRLIDSILIDNNLDQDAIYLNEKTLKKLNINANFITLHFGQLTKKLMLITDPNLKPGKIILPCKLSNEISIPNLKYECYFKENDLFLGPVIGYLVSNYSKSRRKLHKHRFSNYDKINGLTVLFKQSTINKSNKTITGYYYNHKTKSFIKGTFPYPSAIFNRTRIKPATYRHFKKHIGENLFNHPFINGSKWEFSRRMSRSNNIKMHLPKTIKYKGITSLIRMVTKYKSVYLKPIALSRGRGILHVKIVKNGYTVSDHSGYKKFIKSQQALSTVLKNKLIKNGNYIIQQEIKFHNASNKLDFRVYIQKDKTMEWKYSGLETKIAKAGSVISNSKNREKIIPGKKALKEIFHLTDSQTNQKIEELTDLCIKVLKISEKNRAHLGDAAIDFVMDKDCKIWLLEVQVNYAAEKKATRTKDEKQVLPDILPTPFEYAKALAAF